MESTQLRSAYAWTCDECGNDNFENLIILEEENSIIPNDVIDMIKEQIGDSGADINQINVFKGQAPQFVTCKFCKTKYKTDLSPY